MILSLYVKNFVLIDELTLDFQNGFSAFSGETGAGKSLFIDAISILCGAKVSPSFIQKGAQKAVLEMCVEVHKKHPSLQKLAEAEIEVEDHSFIISKTFTQEGKSTTKVNSRNVTAAFLRDLMSDVIDIHSQHDSQYLLNPKSHLGLLDNFVQDDDLTSSVRTAYKDYKQKQQELDTLLEKEFNQEDLDFFMFQLDEINALDASENEIEELENYQKDMMAFERVSKALNEAMQAIDTSSYENIYEATKALDELEQEALVKIKEEMLNAYYLIDEQKDALHAYANSLEYDEEKLNQVQERLFQIQKIVRKHGHTFKDVLLKKEELVSKIELFSDRDAAIALKQQEIEQLYKEFYKHASKLSEKRKQRAKELEKEIQVQLEDLYLPNAKFEITFTNQDSVHGIDGVEFYISMNKGESLRPLTKVISGGELSRLMLGLKVIFTKLQHIETIIFDEIDTGVSGKVAYAIGQKMKELAKVTQVFSITHLAPVAAHADAHYLVRKEEVNDHTSTSIVSLSYDERIRELAMISTNSLSDKALDAAKELLDSCEESHG
ncbi:DNA replication and repair protein RecN [Breznakia blatticola]|uniref:DNA repair protein RecN n=1 Tax=Breznakia blatticola TaxID=1754012 RepID=A0A4R7ZCT9_9FIRM|nr:DNA repair protein RecN [Breznakia blatticola]TDW14815.1 DNA replication and repair protein RecN [Breznakia blatticola]